MYRLRELMKVSTLENKDDFLYSGRFLVLGK